MSSKIPAAPKVLETLTPAKLASIMGKTAAQRSVAERRIYDSVNRYTSALRRKS